MTGQEAPYRQPGPRTANAPGPRTSPPEEGTVVSFVVGLIYYCLTSSDTDIPSLGLRKPGPTSVTCPIKYSTRSGRLHTCIHGLNYSDSKLRSQQYCQERKRKTDVVCSPILNFVFCHFKTVNAVTNATDARAGPDTNSPTSSLLYKYGRF